MFGAQLKVRYSGRGFFKKMNENTSHTSKNEFIRSVLGRILGLTICFRNELTFKKLMPPCIKIKITSTS